MYQVLESTCLFDWFDAKDDRCIAHQTNTECLMGAGIAKEIARRYPSVYKGLREFKASRDCAVELGECLVVKAENDKPVFNIFAQNLQGSGRRTNYEAFYRGLEKLKFLAKKYRFNEIGMPYGIGCGLGGGSWLVIESMLIDIFGDDKEIGVSICKNV